VPHFGKKSRRVLEGLDDDLQALLNEVIKFIDISLIEGYRSVDRQKELFKLGKAKTLESKHLTAEACDLAPYHNGIDWNNRENFIYMAGVIKGIAWQMGIPIKWGGDWNKNNDLSDNNFDDLNHIELDF
jgi:peptidoglycan L-alanyl-D-glutamate endopeptidase CwlK